MSVSVIDWANRYAIFIFLQLIVRCILFRWLSNSILSNLSVYDRFSKDAGDIVPGGIGDGAFENKADAVDWINYYFAVKKQASKNDAAGTVDNCSCFSLCEKALGLINFVVHFR